MNPACFCGVYGLCPTYGRVSRYGLIDYGNSLDKVGPLSNNMEDLAIALEVMSGYDNKDSTSLEVSSESFSKEKPRIKGLKIGIIKEAFGKGVDKAIEKQIWDTVKKLEAEGARYAEVSLKTAIEYGVPTYYLAGTSEASTNLARYCGMRYGEASKLEGGFNEYFTKVRSKNFGPEVKRRIMAGTFVLSQEFYDAYYTKGQKVRRVLQDKTNAILEQYDFILLPTTPTTAFKQKAVKDPIAMYLQDVDNIFDIQWVPLVRI